jgi:hypothetical protein
VKVNVDALSPATPVGDVASDTTTLLAGMAPRLTIRTTPVASPSVTVSVPGAARMSTASSSETLTVTARAARPADVTLTVATSFIVSPSCTPLTVIVRG